MLKNNYIFEVSFEDGFIYVDVEDELSVDAYSFSQSEFEAKAISLFPEYSVLGFAMMIENQTLVNATVQSLIRNELMNQPPQFWRMAYLNCSN